MKLPKEVTRTLYIQACQDPWNEEADIFVSEAELTLDNYFVVGTHEITLPVPQVDTTAAQIDALEKQQDEILTEAHKKAAMITDKIQSLRALEHKGDAA